MTYDLQNFNYRLTSYVLAATRSLVAEVRECPSETVRVVYGELFSSGGTSRRTPEGYLSEEEIRMAVVSEIHHLMRDLESRHAIKDRDQRGSDAEVFQFQDVLRDLIDDHRASLGLAPMSWPGDDA
ncbi:MAG TPA: hypothetical protein VEK57_11840 [Thermoanaerobaculia bacterium]|nr:hypothetical protein [Thermoanaerobaculia bacterium]